ncbi:MAG: polysaccharide lyase [Gammaproteobacteria bacterium]|nr:polysaccharide lyase [Gammaproteobacteria bacterium]
MMVKSVKKFIFLGLMFIPTASNAWVINFNFDEGEEGVKVTEFSDAAGYTVYDKNIVYSGNGSAQLNIKKGSDGWGVWGGRKKLPTDLGEGDEVWVKIRTFMPENFDYTTNFTLKFLRFHIATAGGGHLGYTDIYINNDGTYRYQNELYTTDNSVAIFGSENPVKKGVWETYVYHVRYSTVNPLVQLYKHIGESGFTDDGKPIGGSLKLIFEEKSDYTLKKPTDKVKHFLLFTYWNGNSPKTQSMYVDDLQVSTVPPEELKIPETPTNLIVN